MPGYMSENYIGISYIAWVNKRKRKSRVVSRKIVLDAQNKFRVGLAYGAFSRFLGATLLWNEKTRINIGFLPYVENRLKRLQVENVFSIS